MGNSIRVLNARLKLRKDTLSNWETQNPILLDGERVLVIDGLYLRTKTGNGESLFSQLPFDDSLLPQPPVNEWELSPKTGNATVLTTAWEADATYSGYGYRASVTVTGLTADFTGLVNFDDTAIALEILKEGGKTYDGGFYIYASEIPLVSVEIESYIFWEDAYRPSGGGGGDGQGEKEGTASMSMTYDGETESYRFNYRYVGEDPGLDLITLDMGEDGIMTYPLFYELFAGDESLTDFNSVPDIKNKLKRLANLRQAISIIFDPEEEPHSILIASNALIQESAESDIFLIRTLFESSELEIFVTPDEENAGFYIVEKTETESEGVEEAPEDGQQYVRQYGSWSPLYIPPTPEAPVQEAPDDTYSYVRKNAAWARLENEISSWGALKSPEKLGIGRQSSYGYRPLGPSASPVWLVDDETVENMFSVDGSATHILTSATSLYFTASESEMNFTIDIGDGVDVPYTTFGGETINVMPPNYSLIPIRWITIKGSFNGVKPGHVTDVIKVYFGSNCSIVAEHAYRGLAKNLREVRFAPGDTPITIGAEAFYGCEWLETVVSEREITAGGTGCFEGCTRLKTVVGVPPDGARSFFGCSRLTSILIPNGVTSIGAEAFRGCSALTSVTIPSSVTRVGSEAFRECTSLVSVIIPTSITIPSSLTSIDSWAFRECTSLVSIEIPYSVTSIGEMAFLNCGLTSVSIPSSVTSIGNYTFAGCSRLTSITIPFVGATLNGASDTHFGYIFGASSYDDNSSRVPSSLKTVIITGGTSIGPYAFGGCDSLISIVIPNSVTSIGYYAFNSCGALSSITIPSGVTSIGGGAFNFCSGLTSVAIPNGVTSIGNFMFSECSSLISITVPGSVVTVGRMPSTNVVG